MDSIDSPTPIATAESVKSVENFTPAHQREGAITPQRVLQVYLDQHLTELIRSR